MASPSQGSESSGASLGQRLARPAQVIIVGSVMFTFISYWRTAAVVLCDLASTAYYIGGIVEQNIGPAAPWFILAVMLFSYMVRWVYIESCSLFVRGGVYRVVREALGGFFAKLAVSALMFDYLLTGPISGVSAGQYLLGLLFDVLQLALPTLFTQLGFDNKEVTDAWKRWGAVAVAIAVTLYFHRQNLLGMHESSDKALKIMIATTIMAVIMLGWCLVTLAVQGPAKVNGVSNRIPLVPDLHKKTQYDPETGKDVAIIDQITGEQYDPLGFLGETRIAPHLRELKGADWLSLLGMLGFFVAFGHSILAMSGEETLAQVYREVESPKLPNFQKAAFIVFLYSMVLTAGISFLAVLLIPENVRMKDYSENLISGLAMNVIGPDPAKLLLNGFVVVIGFLILAGAVNTAIVGSNGVLNRVAEDGVMPDWFLKPHPRYGTTYRVLWLIVGLQLVIIALSGGNTLLLGEAYAFGVVWSFVFQALSMVVLRFRDPRPREFKVPLNLRIGSVEIPILLGFVLLVLLGAAITNLFTKEVATISGLVFTGFFFSIFLISERLHEKRRHGVQHQHLEQFNQATTEEITPASLRLTSAYRRLVAIRSPQNLYMLEKTLAETDPETTDTIIMTAKVEPREGTPLLQTTLDTYDQQLMTAVVQRAEKAGKEVRPLIVPTNNPLYAVIRTAKDLKAQELVVGASNKYTADEQLEQIAFYWINMHDGQPAPLTVRILGRDRDVHLDLGGGNRIPKISERQARSVAELRAAGVGVQRVLMAHDGSPEDSDLFQSVLTMLDPQVTLALAALAPVAGDVRNGPSLVGLDQERAKQLGRDLEIHPVRAGDPSAEVVRLAHEGKYELVIVGLKREASAEHGPPLDGQYVLKNAHCRVFLTAPPAIPQEPESPPSPAIA